MCLTGLQLSAIDPVVDGPGVSSNLKQTAAEFAKALPAVAARFLVAAAVIDGLHAIVVPPAKENAG